MELDALKFKRTMQTIWEREYADTLPSDTEYNSAAGRMFVDYLLDSYGVQVYTTPGPDSRLNIERVSVIDLGKYMWLQLKFC